MRDEQHGAGVVREKCFEPPHRLDVEMVRRLVEQQQIRLPRPARAPAARGAASRPTVCPCWRRRGSEAWRAPSPLAAPRATLSTLASATPSATMSKARRSSADERILRQPADAQSRLVPDGRRSAGDVAADDLKQCRLAGAVPADHADALARFDPKAGLE